MFRFGCSYRQGLMLAAACSLSVTAPLAQALAQSAAADPSTASAAASPTGAPPAATQENIVVTGSRIQQSNATSENPVVVVTSAQIQRSSAQNLEDILQKIPSIGTSGVYATTNNAGDGLSCTDIRNLGISRTLVLVDGRRFVHTGGFGFDCVDLNDIPLALVDRIEVLKDGASSIYGADAVAGVINIILKKRFDGSEVRVNGGITGSGDHRQGDLAFTSGGNFDNGRGNAVVSLGYTNESPVEQKDRSYAVPVAGNNTPGIDQHNVSGSTPGARVLGYSDSLDVLSLGNGQFRPWRGNPDRYDFGPFQWLAGSVEREIFSGQVHYDVTPNIQAYLQTYFSHNTTNQQLAPQPVLPSPTNILPLNFEVPAGNPYNPFGEQVTLFRRLNEFGNRDTTTNVNTYQITGGFDGSLPYGWDYDTFFTYGRSDNLIAVANSVNFQRLENEVGFRQTNTANGDFDTGIYDPSVCQAANGCVIVNPFGPNSISQAGVNYARFTEKASSSFTLRTFGGSVTNKDVFDLPFGPLGMALGVEHRRETGEYSPDNLTSSGLTLSNPQLPTAGGFDVTEIFGELKIPILKDLPGVKDLSVDVSGRYFSYNTFGDGETWKAGFNYTPFPGIRFRGNTGTAFRQPSVQELFGGQAASFNTATDPCQLPYANANVAANCAKQGLKSSFTQSSGQVNTTTGGNPNLLPETARTQTVGTVINPPFLKDLTVTVDYWRTKVANQIASLGATLGTQGILDACYQSAGLTNPLCTLIQPRDRTGQLTTVTALNANLGEIKTDGMDIGLTYVFSTGGYGTFTFSNELALTFNYSAQGQANSPFIGFTGVDDIGGGGIGYPRKRDNASVDWTFGDYRLGYRMRYISALDLYNGGYFTPKTDFIHSSTDEVFYHDIVAEYVHNNATVSVGIDNLLEKKPPFVFDTATNTSPGIYDIYGRVFFVKSSIRF